MTYQTNLNHLQHSKFTPLRLTLRMLWFLRAPLMVRTAFIALLLAVFFATSADAVRVDTLRTRPHATTNKTTVHRSRRPSRPAVRSSKPASRAPRTSGTQHNSRVNARRGMRPASPSSRRASTPTSRSARLRRARYNSYHSDARFVPLTVLSAPASRPRAERMNIAAAADNSASSAAAAPSHAAEAESSSDTSSEPRPVEPSTAEPNMPAETDTLPTSGTDRASMAAANNPLSTPRQSVPTISPATGQVAELHRPPIFSGRVSSFTLRGTHDSLVRQNERSQDDALERIEDDADLQDRISRGLLVRVPESAALTVNAALPEDRRYCRPWTANFLTTLANAHHAQFHTSLVVSSAVRTVEYQKRLMRTNHNAADAEGDIVSPHLTGATIDIAKSGLSRREMEWMRTQLLGYQNAGVLDVEEEFHQRCFHITVYKNYGPGSLARRSQSLVPSTPIADTSGAIPGTDVTPNDR